MAARTNHPEAVHMLLRLGAAINARDQLAGYTPLHCAALGGAVQAINALVAAGAELEARCAQQGRTPILVAASEARLDAIATLAGHGAEFDVADSKPVNIKGNEIQVSAYMLCMLAAEKQGILSSEVDATFNRIRDKRYSKKGASR
jgi:ankyrin repeat protein